MELAGSAVLMVDDFRNGRDESVGGIDDGGMSRWTVPETRV